MENVYVIYDDVIEDADVIAVPNEIYQDIEKLANVFMEWLTEDVARKDQEYWRTLNGKQYLNIETKGFVKWLNIYYCKECDKAYIVKQHTEYYPKYKCIEF